MRWSLPSDKAWGHHPWGNIVGSADCRWIWIETKALKLKITICWNRSKILEVYGLQIKNSLKGLQFRFLRIEPWTLNLIIQNWKLIGIYEEHFYLHAARMEVCMQIKTFPPCKSGCCVNVNCALFETLRNKNNDTYETPPAGIFAKLRMEWHKYSRIRPLSNHYQHQDYLKAEKALTKSDTPQSGFLCIRILTSCKLSIFTAIRVENSFF